MFQGKNGRRAAWLTVLMCLTLMLIWENSIRPGAVSMQRSQRVAQWLLETFGAGETIRWVALHIRKVAHFMEYAALGALGSLMIRVSSAEGKGHYRLHLLFFCLLAAVADEALQGFADRGSQVTDVVLDFSGALTGTGAEFALGGFFSILWGQKK